MQNVICILFCLTLFYLALTTRVKTYVAVIRYQGVLLTILLLLPLMRGASLYSFLLPVALFAIKAVVIPRYMNRIILDLDMKRVIEPTIQQITFLLTVIVSMILIFAASDFLSLATDVRTIPFATGCTAVVVGIYIIVFRKALIVHVIGFLVLENGVFLFGSSIGTHMPIMIELGTLLDIFVVVFLMGIAMNKSNSTFSGSDGTGTGMLEES